MKMHLLATGAVGAVLLALGACATQPKVVTAHFTPCEDVKVAIYFEPRSAVLSKEARAVLKGAASQARDCHVDGVDVLGLADAVGAADANFKLSEQRAAVVTKTLRGYGLGEAKVGAAGDIGAVSSSGVADPLRRRADVIVRLSAKT